MELRDIIRGSCQKDPAAQRQLFDRFAGKVAIVCRRYSNSAEEAREMSQECFYQILKCIKKYDPAKGEFEAWLYKLCYYTILNQKKKHIKFYELHPSHIQNEKEEPVEYPISGEELITHIQQLPEGYRIVLNLFVFEGLSHDEIAQVLDITASTSRSQLTRARALLKRRLMNKNPKRYVSRSV